MHLWKRRSDAAITAGAIYDDDRYYRNYYHRHGYYPPEYYRHHHHHDHHEGPKSAPWPGPHPGPTRNQDQGHILFRHITVVGMEIITSTLLYRL